MFFIKRLRDTLKASDDFKNKQKRPVFSLFQLFSLFQFLANLGTAVFRKTFGRPLQNCPITWKTLTMKSNVIFSPLDQIVFNGIFY